MVDLFDSIKVIPQALASFPEEPPYKDPPVFSVSQISTQLRKWVESKFTDIKVQGEISGLKKHSSGHSYFSLKDSEAVLNAICWRGTHLNFPLEEGLEVIAQGRLSTYPGRSNYQMIVSQVELSGEGSLFKLLAQRKEKLAKEGLFSRKRALPAYPKIIGVITSPTGAVIQDIRHRITDRYPCRIIVWPVAVQGQGASEQIAQAIHGFNNFSDSQKPDVLIVARGGGSIEDLWAFNEEIVVRAASNSKIPIISAVGHETDTTLIDYASDLRAPTPTAAAELATPIRNQIEQDLREKKQKLFNFIQKEIQTKTMVLRLRKIPSPLQWIENKWLVLDDKTDRLRQALIETAAKLETKFFLLKRGIKHPDLALSKLKIQTLSHQNNVLIHQLIKTYEMNLQALQQRLNQSSYASILQKGFCFVSDKNGQGILSENLLMKTKPSVIELHFIDGTTLASPIYKN